MDILGQKWTILSPARHGISELKCKMQKYHVYQVDSLSYSNATNKFGQRLDSEIADFARAAKNFSLPTPEVNVIWARGPCLST